jgi:hypothetical protein
MLGNGGNVPYCIHKKKSSVIGFRIVLCGFRSSYESMMDGGIYGTQDLILMSSTSLCITTPFYDTVFEK